MAKKSKTVKTVKPETAPKKKNFFARVFGYLWRKKWWILGIIIVAVLALIIFGGSAKKDVSPYTTVAISRGNLRQVVTATGEIKPLNTIKVGSQVSGTIEKIYADYNDQVKKGQVLLEIDPSVLQASVDEAKASLDSAKSQRNFDKSEYERSKTLFDAGYIARSEMEQYKTKFETSEQSVKRMQSQYDRAMTNLGYATITSPVDGTVISRKVDEGQTVAASFQTPDLFEIAEDLKLMQIETSVSEADIGMIKNGQNVTFTVDAYPTQTFNGDVKQIRLSPTTSSNVVIYTVIIDVDNSDLRLMPGMTAFVTVVIAEKENVWKAQNAAFLVRSLKTLSDDERVQSGEMTPANTLLVLRGEKTVLVPFEKGIVTATETEIISDGIEKDDRIIISKTGIATSANGGGNRGGGNPMGGGPR